MEERDRKTSWTAISKPNSTSTHRKSTIKTTNKRHSTRDHSRITEDLSKSPPEESFFDKGKQTNFLQNNSLCLYNSIIKNLRGEQVQIHEGIH